MAKDVVRLSKSEDFKLEYSAKIVRIGECVHIEGTESYAVTEIDGAPIVVNESEVKQGDLKVYFCNETQILFRVLSCNNQFKNSRKNVDKSKTGRFGRDCRVRPLTLFGQTSFGFLADLRFLAYNRKLKIDGAEIEEGMVFDTVNDVQIVTSYLPPKVSGILRRVKRSQKRINRFRRIIPDVFKLHYETVMLAQAGDVIKMDDTLSITLKMHGASGIFSNIPTLEPIKRPFWKKWIVSAYNGLIGLFRLPESKKIPVSNMVFGNVYSSRLVIKNLYYNDNFDGDIHSGFYGTDIWSEVNGYIKPWLDAHPGFTIYGEIVGYCDEGRKEIQPQYDYGCVSSGENAPRWKFFPYRITYTDDSFAVKEYEISEVIRFTQQMKDFCENELKQEKGYVNPIPLLFSGSVSELFYLAAFSEEYYSDKTVTKKVIKAIKAIKAFGMEKSEPLCSSEVPREGVIVRIDNDSVPRAFKVKCEKFMLRESEAITKGEWEDMEMAES